jgi:hypothetical protein
VSGTSTTWTVKRAGTPLSGRRSAKKLLYAAAYAARSRACSAA